jgi:hypothetical protein
MIDLLLDAMEARARAPATEPTRDHFRKGFAYSICFAKTSACTTDMIIMTGPQLAGGGALECMEAVLHRTDHHVLPAEYAKPLWSKLYALADHLNASASQTQTWATPRDSA